jgi:hypothetical protein
VTVSGDPYTPDPPPGGGLWNPPPAIPQPRPGQPEPRAAAPPTAAAPAGWPAPATVVGPQPWSAPPADAPWAGSTVVEPHRVPPPADAPAWAGPTAAGPPPWPTPPAGPWSAPATAVEQQPWSGPHPGPQAWAEPRWPGPGPQAWPGRPDPAPPAPPAGTGARRTVPLVIATVVVAVVVAVAAVWVLRPSTTPVAASPPAGPAAAAAPASTPAPNLLPTRQAPAPSTGGASAPGLVTLSAQAAAHPQATAVQDLLTAHFTAINDGDYDAWSATVDPRRAADQPQARWTQDFRSTRDSGVTVAAITDGPGGVVVDLSFVSEQDVADAPPDLPAPRICWSSQWPVVDGVLGAPQRGSTTRRAC